MYQDIDQVIAEDVEPAELVIEGKGKINNSPRLEKPARRGKVRQIPDPGILYNGVDVVKDEGTAPGVTVNNKGRKGYDNQRKPRRQKGLSELRNVHNRYPCHLNRPVHCTLEVKGVTPVYEIMPEYPVFKRG